jgi:hypothetical protein
MHTGYDNSNGPHMWSVSIVIPLCVSKLQMLYLTKCTQGYDNWNGPHMWSVWVVIPLCASKLQMLYLTKCTQGYDNWNGPHMWSVWVVIPCVHKLQNTLQKVHTRVWQLKRTTYVVRLSCHTPAYLYLFTNYE